MPSYRFGADQRIKLRSDFLRLQNQGLKFFSRGLLVFVSKNNSGSNRLGITVSTKVNPLATRRNKIKRRVREIYRKAQDRLAKGHDIVVIARNSANDCSYQELSKQLLGCLRQAGFLNNNP